MHIIDPMKISLGDLIKLLGAAVAFGLALYQYVMAQKWKRREFIAQQIKEFEADAEVRMMMKIFDWTDRTFFFPADNGGPPIEVKVTDDLLCSALLPHRDAVAYDLYEVFLRDRIDGFLDVLVRLDNFVEAKLIRVDELKTYMSYWIKLISGAKKDYHSPRVWALLLNYIKEYDFPGAANLIKQFGCKYQPDPAVLAAAIERTVEYRKTTTFHVATNDVVSVDTADKLARGMKLAYLASMRSSVNSRLRVSAAMLQRH